MAQRCVKQDPIDKGGNWDWPDSSYIELLRDQRFAAPDLATQQKVASDPQKQVMIDVPYVRLTLRDGLLFHGGSKVLARDEEEYIRKPYGVFPIGAPMASVVGMEALTGQRDFAKVRAKIKAAAMPARAIG